MPARSLALPSTPSPILRITQGHLAATEKDGKRSRRGGPMPIRPTDAANLMSRGQQSSSVPGFKGGRLSEDERSSIMSIAG